MKTTKYYNLPCFDSRKSFYGKAKVIETEDGEKLLQSYNTIVCKVTAAGEFVRMWSGESMTTMRHINSFLLFVGITGEVGGVSWWRKQPINEISIYLNTAIIENARRA